MNEVLQRTKKQQWFIHLKKICSSTIITEGGAIITSGTVVCEQEWKTLNGLGAEGRRRVLIDGWMDGRTKWRPSLAIQYPPLSGRRGIMTFKAQRHQGPSTGTDWKLPQRITWLGRTAVHLPHHLSRWTSQWTYLGPLLHPFLSISSVESPKLSSKAKSRSTLQSGRL